MKKILLICSILTSHLSYGAVDSLILNHASWKFLDVGSSQANWATKTFNDASWASGNSQLGYGDGDEQTVVSYGPNINQKYVTTYFRRSFFVNNPALYTSLTLNLICDDGAVVYLNGVEMQRENMPVGVISYPTSASIGIGVNENAWHTYTLSSGQLTAANLSVGNNVIAVEIHQFVETSGFVTSTDISFNLTLAATISTAVGGDTLVNNHSYWKYLDNGSNQGTAWYGTGFNDASWAAGNAELGYGDGDEATVVSFGPSASDKYTTTYFRRVFNVASGASYGSLDLSLVCDDGAVVYLNGTEIYRNNMPTGSINHLTSANTGTTNENNWNNITLCSALLAGQPNTIAVEIHQYRDPTVGTVTSSDISFNLRLKGNTAGSCPVTVTRGPYLQMLGTNSVVVRWQTATATDSKVSYGLTTGYGSSVTNAIVSTEHEVSVPGLTQDTKYFYQIGSTTYNVPSDAQTFFKTALPAGTTTDFTTWVTGDFGTGSSGQTGVRDAYTAYAAANLPNGKADFWLWLGDNAYNSGTVSEYNSYVFSIYPNIMKNTPIFPSVGNHDYANHGDAFPGALFPYPTAPYEYFNAFTMPQNAELGGVASTTKRYYSYNYGNVHFIVLDSYGVVTNSNAIDAVNNPMYTWLRNDLIANTKKWTVCYFHHPPYSLGTHNSDTEPGMINMRQNYVPLLETYHVDLVLSGHSHVYERSYLLKGHFGLETTLDTVGSSMILNYSYGDVAPYYTKTVANGVGTVYAVCGNSGQGGVVGTKPSYPHAAMRRSFATVWGSMILTFKNDEIDAKFLTSTGTINDSFKIIKNSCVAGVTVEESVASGDWHTTSTWGCGTIPTTDSMVKINSGHIVTLNTANTADIKKIYVFGMLRYLSSKQLRLKN
jgi:Calcineurin-like phosphoesterase/Purple acid Phosphatase, N-terminal domain